MAKNPDNLTHFAVTLGLDCSRPARKAVHDAFEFFASLVKEELERPWNAELGLKSIETHPLDKGVGIRIVCSAPKGVHPDIAVVSHDALYLDGKTIVPFIATQKHYPSLGTTLGVWQRFCGYYTARAPEEAVLAGYADDVTPRATAFIFKGHIKAWRGDLVTLGTDWMDGPSRKAKKLSKRHR